MKEEMQNKVQSFLTEKINQEKDQHCCNKRRLEWHFSKNVLYFAGLPFGNA